MIKKVLFLSLIAGFIFILSCMPEELTYDEALSRMDRLIDRITLVEDIVTRGEMLETRSSADLKNTLPDIRKYAITVEPPYNSNAVVIEIFSSTEKAGTSKPDNWLTIIGEEFNRKKISLKSGKTAQVRIRAIPSGTAALYIASRKYIPDAYTPSNHLWIKMIEAYGITTRSMSEQLVGNTAGVVMKQSVYKTLEEKSPTDEVGIETILESVATGEMAMGYTDPFASSTGLNFLITILSTYAKGNESLMLSPEVVSAFEAFQVGVPFVSLTTLQMRDSVQNNGSLDAFVMEHQTYLNTSVLRSGYKFIPFGIKHANPLYALENNNEEKIEVLQELVKYTQTKKSVDKATSYKFNKITDYTPKYAAPSGDLISKAQALWKEKKDSGRPIVAVFLADVSGSMGGTPIMMLQEALTEGSKFINPDNYIGLATFSDKVEKKLEIKTFNDLHRAAFLRAVKEMVATGSTAIYDGIIASLQMIIDKITEVPKAKPMLFVLTDGERTEGLFYETVKPVIGGIGIPIYTIGYNANIGVLKEISSINEAAYKSADDENISYILGALLNAEM